MRHVIPSEASACEIVDSLLVFNEPLLDRRFHAFLLRHLGAGEEGAWGVPLRLCAATRQAYEGAHAWMASGARSTARDFAPLGERRLAESFLLVAHHQARLASWMAAQAPTEEVRRPFAEAAETFSQVAAELEALMARLSHAVPGAREEAPALLSGVQHEDLSGDLRGQVLRAIGEFRKRRRGPCTLVLSHTAYRHLRDQGCFRGGETTLAGVPVAVDFGWDGSCFALETDERVLLDEVLRQGGARLAQEGAEGALR